MFSATKKRLVEITETTVRFFHAPGLPATEDIITTVERVRLEAIKNIVAKQEDGEEKERTHKTPVSKR